MKQVIHTFKTRFDDIKKTKTFLNAYYAGFLMLAVGVTQYQPHQDIRGKLMASISPKMCVAHFEDWLIQDAYFREQVSESLSSLSDVENKEVLDNVLADISEKVIEQQRIAKLHALKNKQIDTSKTFEPVDIAKAPEPDIEELFEIEPVEKVSFGEGDFFTSPIITPPVITTEDDIFNQNKLVYNSQGEKPKIAFIFDDLGGSKYTKDVVNFPGPMTMAFLPDSENVQAQFQNASSKGHEVIIHMPMEAMSQDFEEPHTLKTNMSYGQITKMLNWAFERAPGVIGINNHTGSKFTSSARSLEPVMAYLKRKGGVFIDSKTASNSKALKVAKDYGVTAIGRDVFLDHEDNEIFIRNALVKTQAIAKRHGYAVAIGHPRQKTVEIMAEWLESDAAKNFEIVPVSEIIRLKAKERSKLVQASGN